MSQAYRKKRLLKATPKQSKVGTHIVGLKVAIAAFLTPKIIIEELKKIDLKDYDLVLTPGLVCEDVVAISKAVGIPVFKGSRYDADLPLVLDMLGQVKLSTVVPADDLLRERLEERAFEEIEKTEKNRLELLKEAWQHVDW